MSHTFIQNSDSSAQLGPVVQSIASLRESRSRSAKAGMFFCCCFFQPKNDSIFVKNSSEMQHLVK